MNASHTALHRIACQHLAFALQIEWVFFDYPMILYYKKCVRYITSSAVTMSLPPTSPRCVALISQRTATSSLDRIRWFPINFHQIANNSRWQYFSFRFVSLCCILNRRRKSHKVFFSPFIRKEASIHSIYTQFAYQKCYWQSKCSFNQLFIWRKKICSVSRESTEQKTVEWVWARKCSTRMFSRKCTLSSFPI